MAESGSRAADVRITIAAAGVLLIASLCGAVVLAQQSEDRSPTPLSTRCLNLWNASPAALLSGYHNFHRHGYREAEVLWLDAAGYPAARGRCAVVFPSQQLDREPRAGAKVFAGKRWRPLAETLAGNTALRLSELQFAAIERANAVLNPDGTLQRL